MSPATGIPVSDTDAVANFEAWSVAMCSLLDRIEMVAGDEEAVRKLLAGRFLMAEQFGFETVFLGPASGVEQ